MSRRELPPQRVGPAKGTGGPISDFVARRAGLRFAQLREDLKLSCSRQEAAVKTFEALERRITGLLGSATEHFQLLQNRASTMAIRIEEIEDLARVCLGRQIVESNAESADRAVGVIAGEKTANLGSGVAELLNWADAGAGKGFAAQSGCWFMPPLTVWHQPGGVILRDVNERIVEVPFVMSSALDLAPGSAVLDVGSGESTLALTLASLGLSVFALDPRGYPIQHPNIEIVAEPLEQWAGPREPLSAVFCVSTIEHLGLGAYGQVESERPMDHVAMETFANLLHPKGELVLTVPYGAWSVDEFQRVYDEPHLDDLLAGWEVRERRILARTADCCWAPVVSERTGKAWTGDQPGVAMIRATPGPKAGRE